jgi:hypothetical protein
MSRSQARKVFRRCGPRHGTAVPASDTVGSTPTSRKTFPRQDAHHADQVKRVKAALTSTLHLRGTFPRPVRPDPLPTNSAKAQAALTSTPQPRKAFPRAATRLARTSRASGRGQYVQRHRHTPHSPHPCREMATPQWQSRTGSSTPAPQQAFPKGPTQPVEASHTSGRLKVQHRPGNLHSRDRPARPAPSQRLGPAQATSRSTPQPLEAFPGPGGPPPRGPPAQQRKTDSKTPPPHAAFPASPREESATAVMM